MNPGYEIIEFNWLGLRLQEPMALITNWLLAIFSFYAYFQLKKGVSQFQDLWRSFYLVLGISMIFGGLGHIFYQYTSIPGKFPSWTLGVLAGVYVSFAMITLIEKKETRIRIRQLVLVKSFILLSLAILTRKFLFVAIDTGFTYLVFCGYLAFQLHKKNWEGVKLIAIGVLVLLPSAFIFGLKINLHTWLNKDDLSHMFMLGCIICFYLGVRATQELNHHRLSE
jgi:cytochrome c biogenesis protein CcdA